VDWRELGARVPTPVHWGPDLTPGSRLRGHAIVEYPNTTIAVRSGQALTVDRFGSAVLELGEV
jgi:N-methylhydantoinase A